MKRISLTSMLLAATVVLAMEGCAGAGGAGVPPINPFAGSYDGTVNVDNNGVGALSLTVATDGTATGSLAVTRTARPSRALGTEDFPVGNYAVTGSSSSAGLIAISGIVPPDRNFTISGNLPQGVGTSALAITTSMSTYNGTVQAHTSGTGGTLTLEQVTAGNANLAAYPATALASTVTTEPGKKTLTLTENDGFNSRSFSIDIMDTMQVGQTVTFASGEPRIIYNQSQIGQFLLKAWQTSGGTMTLVSRSGDTFSVTLSNVEFIPVPIGGNTATGNFRASGSLHN